jgi:hypothetical protein
MGYPVEVEARFEDGGYDVQIHAGDHEAILIGRRGETLEALQHVLAKMASRGREELIRLRVDVARYKQRRFDELAEKAVEMARTVRETGQETVTEPLPAAERRIIHRTLADDPAVTTHALGDGLVKRVWIGPADAAPPADARTVPFSAPGEAPHESRREAPRHQAHGAEPISLLDSWYTETRKEEAPASGEDWGRKPKPARGRRR